jgi:hypothetical protein
MKKLLKNTVIFLLLLFLPTLMFTQTINVGILSSFEAYTGAGVISNAGTVTGDVGSDNGIITGFDPPAYTGIVYNADSVTAQGKMDLFRLYIHLNDIFVTFPGTHAPAFGGGETIIPGIYSIASAGSIGGTITLDGGGDPDAFFIIKYQGAMTVGANAEVILSNGTQSCNVFWIAEGAISVGADAVIKGTLFGKTGAVGLGADCDMEGRMLSLKGAITVGVGSVAIPPPGVCTIPLNCLDICSPAAAVDVLGSVERFALFTSFGAVANTATSGIYGDIGTDGGDTITGYGNSVHFGSTYSADAITAQAKIDLDIAYNALLLLPNTSTGHTPAFGFGETIYTGVYFINGAGSLGGTITLDGGGDPNAIFVFKFAGAFSVAAQSKVILANGTRHCNVFWVGGAGVTTGAVNIGAFGIMKGTLLSHGGACNSGAGAFIEGRQLSTAGAVNTNTGIVYNDCDENIDCIPAVSPTTLTTCDNSNGTGSGIFFLHDANSIVTTASGVTITYHPSISDAQNDINILVSPYTSLDGTVYARVERISTECFNTAVITLDVGVGCLENCVNGIDDDGDGLIDCDDSDCPCCGAYAPTLNGISKNDP